MFGLWWIFIGFIATGVIALGINILVEVIKYGKDNLDPDDWIVGWGTLIVTVSVALIVFLPACILVPFSAKQEVMKYRNNYEMIQQVIESGTEYDNIAISQTLIEYNAWLSGAKADKQMWGNWSEYVYEDLDSLTYIHRLSKN